MFLGFVNIKCPQTINNIISWSASYPTPSDVFTCNLCWKYNMVVSTYHVIILPSLFIIVTADMTVMKCQLKAITIHALARDSPHVSCVSHFGAGKFLYVN